MKYRETMRITASASNADAIPKVVSIIRNPASTTNISANDFSDSRYDAGLIGNNRHAFVIDMPKDPAGCFISKLNSDLGNVVSDSIDIVSFSNAYFHNFCVFPMDDYGSETMTAFLHEMVIKVYDDSGKLINPKRVAVLRQYFSKTAFILIDLSKTKAVLSDPTNSDNTYAAPAFVTVIVDFHNRLTDSEYFSYDAPSGMYSFHSRYKDIPTGRNFISYVGDNVNGSVYYDRYITTTAPAASVLEKQENYFSYLLDDKSMSPSDHDILMSPVLLGNDSEGRRLSISTGATFEISEDDLSDYLGGSQYEVYRFITEGSYGPLSGTRLFPNTAVENGLEGSYFYYGYEKRPDVVHYGFRLSIAESSGSLKSFLHSEMKAADIYLFDYDFGVTAFDSAGCLVSSDTLSPSLAYADIYISLPYDGHDEPYMESIPTYAGASTASLVIFRGNSSSVFDPTAAEYQSFYANDANAYLPFFVNDGYIASWLPADYAFLKAENASKQPLSIFDVKRGTLLNSRFDVLFGSNGIADADTVSEADYTALRNTSLGFYYRNAETAPAGSVLDYYASLFTDINKVYANMLKFIPASAVYTSVAGQTVLSLKAAGAQPNDDCLATAISIRVGSNPKSDAVPVTTTEGKSVPIRPCHGIILLCPAYATMTLAAGDSYYLIA